MRRSISASRLTMVILCMTMSMILRSRDCHFSLAALLKLWLAPFFWNFFLGGRGQGALADSSEPLSAALLRPLPRAGSSQPRHQSSPWPCPQSTHSSPGWAAAGDSACRVVPQEVVDFSVPLTHYAGDRAGSRFSLRRGSAGGYLGPGIHIGVLQSHTPGHSLRHGLCQAPQCRHLGKWGQEEGNAMGKEAWKDRKRGTQGVRRPRGTGRGVPRERGSLEGQKAWNGVLGRIEAALCRPSLGL